MDKEFEKIEAQHSKWSKNYIENCNKKLVNKLASEISATKQSLVEGYDERELDIFVINPKYISQEEKDIIYSLYKFVQKNNNFTDAKLKEFADKHPMKLKGLKELTTNFPNIIKLLWNYGYDGAIEYCAKDRLKVTTIENYIRYSTLIVGVKSNESAQERNKRKKRENLHGLFTYIHELNEQFTDEDLQSLIKRYPDKFAIFAPMIEEYPTLVEILKDEGYSYVSNNILGLGALSRD